MEPCKSNSSCFRSSAPHISKAVSSLRSEVVHLGDSAATEVVCVRTDEKIKTDALDFDTNASEYLWRPCNGNGGTPVSRCWYKRGSEKSNRWIRYSSVDKRTKSMSMESAGIDSGAEQKVCFLQSYS